MGIIMSGYSSSFSSSYSSSRGYSSTQSSSFTTSSSSSGSRWTPSALGGSLQRIFFNTIIIIHNIFIIIRQQMDSFCPWRLFLEDILQHNHHHSQHLHHHQAADGLLLPLEALSLLRHHILQEQLISYQA